MARRSEHLRRQVGSKVVEGMYLGLAGAAVRTPPARRALQGVRIVRDVRYAPGNLAAHTLDVYAPRGATDALPVVFYVHGGGFRILSKDTHWLMGLAFARRGFVVVNVNYRLAPGHPFPAAVEDVFAAWEWTLDHVAKYHGDPSAIVVAGESAGANLVTTLAMATTGTFEDPLATRISQRGHEPVALLANCGMLQVSDPHRFQRRKPLPGLIFDRIEEVARDYLGHYDHRELADPLVVLERRSRGQLRLPPTFASAGTRDPILDDTRRLEAALVAHGVPNEVRYYPGEVHAFHALLWRRQARTCWIDQFEFLDRLGLGTRKSERTER